MSKNPWWLSLDDLREMHSNVSDMRKKHLRDLEHERDLEEAKKKARHQDAIMRMKLVALASNVQPIATRQD